MKARVFVYGALRNGALHSWRMESSRFVAKGEVEGTLVKIDWYPGLVLGGERTVKGEIYEVTPEVLASLDEFEGVGVEDERAGEYHRVSTMVELADGSRQECLVYEWLKGVDGYEVVQNGDWSTVAL